ncbi:DUF5710 domain-containing protein [Cedecea sp.]|jgi:hypothetical protein|uniref:DUF5710 domain-containing protein n=1 Tax=Cedecea sp. TaxID=1970739 RepID=UPI002F420AB5
MARIDLAVPFAEKDQVKALGGRWDPTNKVWYILEGLSVESFRKWIPFRNVRSPFWYIAQTQGICWKCKESTLLTSVLLPKGHETLEKDDESTEGATFWLKQEKPAFIFYIDEIPRDILINFNKVRHYLSRDFSKTTNSHYWMNHCEHCNQKQGDFSLHCEPNGYFSPLEIHRAENINLHSINSPFIAACGDISHQHVHIHFGDSGVSTSGEMLEWMKIVD